MRMPNYTGEVLAQHALYAGRPPSTPIPQYLPLYQQAGLNAIYAPQYNSQVSFSPAGAMLQTP